MRTNARRLSDERLWKLRHERRLTMPEIAAIGGVSKQAIHARLKRLAEERRVIQLVAPESAEEEG